MAVELFGFLAPKSKIYYIVCSNNYARSLSYDARAFFFRTDSIWGTHKLIRCILLGKMAVRERVTTTQ